MFIGLIMMPPSMMIMAPRPPQTVIATVTDTVLPLVTPSFNPWLFFHAFIMPPMMATVYSLTHTIVQLAGMVSLGIPL